MTSQVTASTGLYAARTKFLEKVQASSNTGLAVWLRFYGGIADTDDLYQLFNEHDSAGRRLIDVNSVEFEALRDVLRDRKGLNEYDTHIQSACMQCLAVVCRCGEDWWSLGDR